MKKIIIAISFSLILISCQKASTDDIQFPEETQSGLNTFGCYIDGKAFIPSTTLAGNVHPISVYYTTIATQYYDAGFLSLQGIDARYSLDFSGDVLIQKTGVFGVGEYSLSHTFNCPSTYGCDAGEYHNAKEDKNYFIESGRLTITKLDTLNKVISGRFYFTSKDSSGIRKEITGGVFDTKYIN